MTAGPGGARGVVAVAVAAAMGAGCAGAPGSAPEVPRYAPADQTTAHAAQSASHPLILEWPAADRAALESQRAGGVVVVRYSGREIEVMRGCRAAAAYHYVALTPKEEDVVMRSVAELAAAMPVHGARLDARIEQKQKLEVAMTIVGMYESDAHAWRAADLTGDCAGATHVIAALTVGAFELSASAETAAGAGATLLGAGVEAHRDASKEVLDRDGRKDACDKSSSGAAAPPYDCGALLRVEVAAITFPATAAACGPGLVQKGGACQPVDPGRPALLDVLQGPGH
ncbi:MAG TPA: hypothetical protein VGL81_20205 [Polyangiaceae bacterium]